VRAFTRHGAGRGRAPDNRVEDVTAGRQILYGRRNAASLRWRAPVHDHSRQPVCFNHCRRTA
jgi:hypothetical protein